MSEIRSDALVIAYRGPEPPPIAVTIGSASYAIRLRRVPAQCGTLGDGRMVYLAGWYADVCDGGGAVVRDLTSGVCHTPHWDGAVAEAMLAIVRLHGNE